jgi:hypothetical protein
MISHFYLSLCIPYETRVILQFGSVLWAYELCDSLISGNLLSIKFSFGNISIYICQLGEMGEGDRMTNADQMRCPAGFSHASDG